MEDLIIATSNKNKVEEFKAMLANRYNVLSLLDLDLNFDVDENGDTFEENALIKARALAKILNKICISDDSGLEIDALNKEPGVKSARYLGHETSYDYKNKVILERMQAFKGDERSCRFVSAIAIVYPNGEEHVFRGVVEGLVADEIIGAKGFGYDPIFYYPPFNTTLANVPLEKKNTVSHRHNALVKLMEFLNEK